MGAFERKRVFRPMLSDWFRFFNTHPVEDEDDLSMWQRWQKYADDPNTIYGWQISLRIGVSAENPNGIFIGFDTHDGELNGSTPNVNLINLDLWTDSIDSEPNIVTLTLRIADATLMPYFANSHSVNYFTQLTLWQFLKSDLWYADALAHSAFANRDFFISPFSGYLDNTKIVDAGSYCDVTLTFIDESSLAQSSLDYRYTDQDQKNIPGVWQQAGESTGSLPFADYTSDKGFEYVEAIQNWSGFWGVVANADSTKPAGKKKSKPKKKGHRRR